MDLAQTLPKGSALSAMLLVAGTCIGGGMLALPVATGINGFLPSLAIMFICWLAMTLTALLLLEASLWMEEGVHMITMTSRLLGVPGKIVSWILFLFISYASLVAYTAGGGLLMESGFQSLAGFPISKELACLLFIIIFGSVIYMGSAIIGRVNSILFAGMIAAYFALVAVGVDEIKPGYLLNQKWKGSYLVIPLFLTAFSFQTMVPSLTQMLKKNAKALRFAVIGGTALVFIIYMIWQGLILGIVPVGGPNGLAVALQKGEPATQFLTEHVEGPWIIQSARAFAFFAIVTSFLGIALGLFDFLADGLKLTKKGLGGILIALLVAVPTFICAVKFERIFLLALDTTGGYGDSILNGIMPVLMVWIGRYKLGYSDHLRVPGGKIVLFLILVFFTSTLVMEILAHAGVLNSFYQAYEMIDVHQETL